MTDYRSAADMDDHELRLQLDRTRGMVWALAQMVMLEPVASRDTLEAALAEPPSSLKDSKIEMNQRRLANWRVALDWIDPTQEDAGSPAFVEGVAVVHGRLAEILGEHGVMPPAGDDEPADD